jgi:endonuclease/exonuclease/phosphatase family metal-dependent hydrolase
MIGAILILPFFYRLDRPAFYFLGLVCLLHLPRSFQYFNIQLGARTLHASEQQLGILSFNTMMGAKMLNRNNELKEDVKKTLNSAIHVEFTPDVLCLQESNAHMKNQLGSHFEYPHEHSIDGRGTFILSRYPIIASGQVDFGPGINSCLWADIQTGTNVIRIYTVHLKSNRLPPKLHHMLTEEERPGMGQVEGLKDLFSKYNQYAGTRADQALQIKQHMDQSPYPVILCGDFNEPPGSYTYRTLKAGLTDAYGKSGVGLGTTWKSMIPLVRIDYIFSSEEIKSERFVTVRNDLSDHYPVKALFTM